MHQVLSISSQPQSELPIMPRIIRGLKAIFAKEQSVVVEESLLQQYMNRFMSMMEEHLPSDLINKSSELYSRALDEVANFTRDKSHGELIFMGSICAAVVLFVIVLPLCEAFSTSRSTEKTLAKRSTSSNSSATESLETIEESEEEDLPDPIEVIDSLKFVEEDDDMIQVYDDQPFASIAKAEHEDDKASDSTPVTTVETPTASPCVTPLRSGKPGLNKEHVSVPHLSSAKTRSSFAKMKGKMSSSISFRRRESSDASVTSTSSSRSFKLFGKKSKKA